MRSSIEAISHSGWGGSPLRVHCTRAELVRLWRRIAERHPAVWLHDAEDCTMCNGGRPRSRRGRALKRTQMTSRLGSANRFAHGVRSEP
jgi:hypothetical protein